MLVIALTSHVLMLPYVAIAPSLSLQGRSTAVRRLAVLVKMVAKTGENGGEGGESGESSESGG